MLLPKRSPADRAGAREKARLEDAATQLFIAQGYHGTTIWEIACGARVSSTEAIRWFALPERDVTLEDDELTPTMKVKRAVVAARSRDLIEQLSPS